MRFHSYSNSAKKIIETYKGDIPFAVFIKKYFAANKKYGSKDRKQIAALCYNFYRLGKALPQLPIAEKLIVAVFLCEQESSDFLHFHKPEWNAMIAKPLMEKLAVAGLAAETIFPWADELSTGIGYEPFCNSHLVQPLLYVRIRPGKKDDVLKKLLEAQLLFNLLQQDCIALPNGTKLDAVLKIDEEVIIQDYSSQQVLNFLKTASPSLPNHPAVWDCCAASGGKSMLAFDILKADLQLTVSDIRESILSNLKKRFETAGIKNYQSFIADLTTENIAIPIAIGSQLIICDAPCTGSGTWSRTPEQLYYFKKKSIDEYAAIQQKIVSHVIPQLKPGGIFIYITCSVFKKENDAIVDFIKEKYHLQLLQMELLKGYETKADSMFVAVFKK